MELRTLRSFLAVAREGNVTRAARSLHITQPALSRQLAELERELGCELLKLPHHGRYAGNTGKLLDKLQPRFAVSCASAYDEKTLAELDKRGIETFLTADGPVTAVSDGKSWRVTQ